MSKLTNGRSVQAGMDKSKDWQLELLMEKLRSKSAQFKSLTEISKNVRMTMLDKRFALDSVDKSQHQKCLDTLQHCIKVTSLQSMVERLESLTRQLGLKFVQGPSGVELFISSDMFYLEIILDQNGAVLDVKVHHDGKPEQQSCKELVSCLSKGDFSDFTAQLEGFASIYQLNAEKKVKSKAFTALQSLEADLSTLAQLQMFMKEPFNLLHKSPVGILEKRKGGHPMKLTYFVSPYDLINLEKCDTDPLTVEGVTMKSLGYSVTVCMEGSAAHKLQTTTLITVNKNPNGKNTPTYAPVTNQNSAVIPACFVLRLNKPMPMCATLVRQIYQITELLECADLSTTQPLLSLIATHCTTGKVEAGANKGLFVTLPDQHHCYFMTENKNMDGILVNSIPFTHPGHVAQILVILRQQALFNTIISSCVRPNSKQDFESMMFEVSALSWTQISISLEHPLEESMATAEIDLSDISNLICRIHSPGTPPPANAPDLVTELATKHLNRSFSIPVTMRSVIRYWEKQIARKNHFIGHENFNLPLGSGDPGGRNNHPGGNGLTDFGNLDGKVKQENSSAGGMGHGMNLPLMSQHNQTGMFLNETLMSNDNFSNFSTGDAASVLTNMELTSILSGASDKPKRKKRDEWKSSKRKTGDDGDLLDASSCDSTSRSTPLSQETCSEIPTPNSGLGFHSDFDSLDTNELIDKGEFENVDDIDVEDILLEGSKFRKKSPTPIDLDNKLPSVSITPILSSNFNQSRVDTLTSSAISSSITITPIPSSHLKNEDRSRERKSGKSSKDDKSKLDKKRKRKREESPMGPPERIPCKQDPLSKPVSVSIKPAESPPLSMTPSSPNMMRKFASSPTQNRKISSPNLLTPGIKTSTHQSPKHSPAHISSSPKHTIGISSPKSHGLSPKHPSTSGSGKPSMSTLKNAANSPSSKSDSSKKSSSKDSSREKDKRSGMFGSNSTKKSSGKVKPLDLNSGSEIPSSLQDGLISPTGLDMTKNSNQARNRKGLQAVIDKLKQAHSEPATDLSSKSKEKQLNKSESSKTNNKLGENKNSEYMVKPSSDGMKITINKTRTKDSKTSNKSVSGTGSPKTHTGLKPGVNSGPASKKPQQLSKSSSGSSLNSSYPFKNASSSNKMVNKVSSLVKSSKSGSATDLRLKDRPKQQKPEKSIFNRERKGSPTQNRDDDYKVNMSKLDPYSAQPLVVEGFVKQLDKKFQIPKLSARISDDKKLNKDSINNDKAYDMSKNDLKYTMNITQNKIFENSIRSINNATSPKLHKDDFNSDSGDEKKQHPQNMTSSNLNKDEMNYKLNYNLSKAYEPLSLTTKSIDLTSKFVAPAPKDDKKDRKEIADGLLDYSKDSKMSGQSMSSVGFPQSPSVSVHIVKSPAPSPMINPSPHSASSCITDDELMDEALVGLGK